MGRAGPERHPVTRIGYQFGNSTDPLRRVLPDECQAGRPRRDRDLQRVLGHGVLRAAVDLRRRRVTTGPGCSVASRRAEAFPASPCRRPRPAGRLRAADDAARQSGCGGPPVPY